MPNSLNNDGISRKIGDIEERKKLKQIITSVNIPEKMSVIVRTAGIGKTKKEISKDLSFLISQWNKIRQLTIKSEAPELIYEEGSILKRTIRDMLTEDVESILVEGKDAFDKIKKLFHISSELISEYGLSYFLRVAFRELLLQKTALFSPDNTSIEIKNEFIVEYDDFLKTIQNNTERDSLKIQDFPIQPSFSLILFVDQNMPSIKKFLDEHKYSTNLLQTFSI